MEAGKQNIYCLSGLGADEKVFAQLHIEGYNLKHLNWLSPLHKESLESYTERMIKYIPEQEPILLGLSFGGMVAIEMAKKIKVHKLILISAAKTYTEIPRWMRIAGSLRLNRILPVKSNRMTEKYDDIRMGIETEEEKFLVNSYRKNGNQQHINWAVNHILNWRNTWLPEQVFHIHGEKDKMFPIKNIQPTYVIKDGTHIMILNKSGEISACIQQILSL